MKNLEILRNPDQVYDYLETIFQTDIFKDAVKTARNHTGVIHQVQTYVDLWAIIHEFAKYPRFFAEMATDVEYSHFSAWWNVIGLRTYDNPYINDLYYLHDMYHMVDRNVSASNAYGATTFYEFFKRTSTNELRASIITEVVIYFMYPELRAKTFPFEIWADRFIDGRKMGWEGITPVGRMHKLQDFRKQAMVNPDPTDWCELQIYGYVQSNIEWAKIWKNNFAKVESHMADFYAVCDNIRYGVDSYDLDHVINNHLDWLKEHSTGLYDVPFEQEARDFHRFYQETHKEYGNHHQE